MVAVPSSLAVRRAAVAALGLTVAVSAAACGKATTGGSAANGAFLVTSTDKGCTLSATTLTTGNQTINVRNNGSIVTEAYLYAPDGRALGEIENVGPGLSNKFSADIKVAGAYQIQCRPGMTGDGVRTALTVTAAAGAAGAAEDPQADAAILAYRTFVQGESDALVTTTTAFATAVRAGDSDASKKAYAAARLHYERIEAVAESFGDLDPKIDSREADQPLDQWTGFHRIEKALYADDDITQMGPVADQLVTDVTSLDTNIKTLEFSVADIGNGAKALMDEVATSKISGEEEAYSHIDLLDFRGNVDGAEKAFEVLTPILAGKDADLLATLTTRFAAVDAALVPYRSTSDPSGYELYTAVTDDGKKSLSALVDALTEPVGQLTGAIVPGSQDDPSAAPASS